MSRVWIYCSWLYMYLSYVHKFCVFQRQRTLSLDSQKHRDCMMLGKQDVSTFIDLSKAFDSILELIWIESCYSEDSEFHFIF